MPNPLFSYKNINQKLITDKEEYIRDLETGYKAELGDNRMVGSSEFIFLGCMDDIGDETKEGNIANMHGLKIHISLPEWDRDKYAQGWDIIKDIIIESRLLCSKVAHENTRMSGGDGAQRGKDVTIYAEYHADKNADFWLRIAQRITQELTDNNIPPGYVTSNTGPRKDTILEGSNYITYRYDKSQPPVSDDIMASLKVNVAKQQAARKLEDKETNNEKMTAANFSAK